MQLWQKKNSMSQPLLSCEVDYRTSWESQNTRDNVWNKLPSALCQKAAKWKSFKIIIFPTTSLMRNMSKIKLKMCSLAAEKGCLTGLLKPMNLIISFTATVQVSLERFASSAGWRETPQGERARLPSASPSMQSKASKTKNTTVCRKHNQPGSCFLFANRGEKSTGPSADVGVI